jgi:hypothetical protein
MTPGLVKDQSIEPAPPHATLMTSELGPRSRGSCSAKAIPGPSPLTQSESLRLIESPILRIRTTGEAKPTEAEAHSKNPTRNYMR